MKKNKLIIIILIILALIGLYFFKKIWFPAKKRHLYSTAKPIERGIKHVVKATGYIEVNNMMKIGSLVSGVVDKMYAEENDPVKKGQLLALIDDGKGDTLVKQAEAQLESAQARLTYAAAYFKRHEQLYHEKQISKDLYERITSEYQIAKAQADQAQAQLNEAQLQFNNKRITAPDDGLVIAKIASEGETVTLSAPPTLIYTIAKDITKMEAKLEIDESTVGNLKINSRAQLRFDTYPHKKFTGIITNISNAPKTVGGAVSYLATIPLDNNHLLFRPGMTVNAEIFIGGTDSTLAIPTNILKLKRNMLEEVAKAEKLKFIPLDEQTHQQLEQQENIKTIWLLKDEAFVEHPIEIGISDNAFYQVVNGLQGDENIIVDTIEPNTMKEFFDQFFGKGLTE